VVSMMWRPQSLAALGLSPSNKIIHEDINQVVSLHGTALDGDVSTRTG